MSAGHRHHKPGHKIDPAHQRELEHLMENPEFVKAVSAYDREDCDHDIPYVGGSSTDGRTIFWDRHLCSVIDAGKYLISGKPQDPRPAGRVHEAIEGAIIRLMRTDYTLAHDIADVAERHAVEHLGWSWPAYQKAWKPFIRVEEHESITNPPADLLLEPYRNTPIYNKLATFQLRARQNANAQNQRIAG